MLVFSDFRMPVKSLIIIINYKSLIIFEINQKLKINIKVKIRWETFPVFIISSSIYGIGTPVQFCRITRHSLNNTTSHYWRKKDAKTAFIP